MKRRIRLYENNSKIIYQGTNPDTNILFFKDDIFGNPAANCQIFNGCGVLNNRISEEIFLGLKSINLPTHFIKRINMREQLVHSTEILPLIIVIRNVAAGSFSKRFDIAPGTDLETPIVEFFYNNSLNPPLVTESHITMFNWATINELDEIVQYSIRANDFLVGYFSALKLKMVDVKLKFGRLMNEDNCDILIAQDISLENLRLIDLKSNKFIIDNTKHNKIANYKEVAKRMNLLQTYSVNNN